MVFEFPSETAIWGNGAVDRLPRGLIWGNGSTSSIQHPRSPRANCLTVLCLIIFTDTCARLSVLTAEMKKCLSSLGKLPEMMMDFLLLSPLRIHPGFPQLADPAPRALRAKCSPCHPRGQQMTSALILILTEAASPFSAAAVSLEWQSRRFRFILQTVPK